MTATNAPRNPNSPSNFLREVGERIRSRRVNAGLTKVKLAALCDTDRTFIAMIEDGDRNFSLERLLRIAKALKVEVRELIPEGVPVRPRPAHPKR
jgi:transcriptional regulator with XRE-family HTH domain